MLRLRQIMKLLSQGLRPVSSSTSGIKGSLVAISLISRSGVPLATVVNPDLSDEEEISTDELKVYSLLAVNSFEERRKFGDSGAIGANGINGPDGTHGSNGVETTPQFHWSSMEINEKIQLVIEEVPAWQGAGTKEEEEADRTADSEIGHDLYVVLFYTKDFPHAIAKLKVENAVIAMSEGLKGFHGV